MLVVNTIIIISRASFLEMEKVLLRVSKTRHEKRERASEGEPGASFSLSNLKSGCNINNNRNSYPSLSHSTYIVLFLCFVVCFDAVLMMFASREKTMMAIIIVDIVK